MLKRLLILIPLSMVFAKPLIEPNMADRTFPYIKYEKAWEGTPAITSDVAVPDVVIVVGENEEGAIVRNAGMIAFYIGNWVEDAGISVSTYKEKNFPQIIFTDKEIGKFEGKNIIVVGTNNTFVRKFNIKFEKPSIKVIRDGKRYIMFVGGKNINETNKAINYLANIRLSFKGGAYTTFFSFVKLRGFIEKGQFEAALDLIRNPRGISACGRNMSIALGMGVTRKWSEKMKNIVKRRNAIMYKKLTEALKERNKEKATSLWEEAMKTCYMCHQGAGIPQVRKFVPNEEIHSKHQRIAKSFGLNCTACHKGFTKIRGYTK